MPLILTSNQKNFDSVAGTTVEKFFAVNRQNQSWPSGLWQTSSLALSKRLRIAPLCAARFFARISDVCRQQNIHIIVNGA